jgi:hypothetical protein
LASDLVLLKQMESTMGMLRHVFQSKFLCAISRFYHRYEYA